MAENRRETIVAGSRIVLACVLSLALPAAVAAQPVFIGLASGHVGSASGGDVRDWTGMGGASMAVLDVSGFGAEVDASYVGGVDSERFSESNIMTVMVNAVAYYPHETFRPFVAAGAGLLRMRAALPGQSSATEASAGWNIGGGLLYMLNEAFGLRGEVRYFRNFGRQDTLPLGGDRTLSFVRTSIGATYSWPMH